MTKKYYIYFFIFYLTGSIISIGFSLLINRITQRDNITKLKTEEKTYLSIEKKVLTRVFEEIYSDIFYLSDQKSLKSFLSTKSPREKTNLNIEYSSFGMRKKRYDQIRIIGLGGMELIRVNFSNITPDIVKDSNLQDKSDRYYFKETLSSNGVYVSPFDLNIENKMIEIPFKPVIRFGQKLTDLSGKEKGVIVLNYLGNNLIDMLQSDNKVSKGDFMILNKDGYWLHGPLKEKLWGFMIENQEHQRFQFYYPDLWQLMKKDDVGQIINDRGLFTWITFSLNDSKKWFWKIISHVPTSEISTLKKSFKRAVWVYNGIVIFFMSIPIFLLTLMSYRRKLYQEKLLWSANYDSLTGLSNRRMFFTILERTIYNASRYNEVFAVIFIDIDGFKIVNDTLGHDMGDKLLISIASRLKESVRESDLVARLGGDEFIILINRIESASDAELVAKKLINTLSERFHIDNNSIHIGASMGISLYPENGKTPDLLVKKADNEMYRCKRNQKNSYSLCKSGDTDGID